MAKKFLSKLLALTSIILLGTNVFVNAAEPLMPNTDPLQESVNYLCAGYSEYYDIHDTNLSLISTQEDGDTTENTYLYEMTVTLKATSVEEMDYYKGVTAYYEIAKTSASKVRTVANQLRISALSDTQADIYSELNAYIGEEQTLTFFLKETFPINNEAAKEILFENGLDYVSWEEMLPANHETLQELGYTKMSDIDSEYALTRATDASYSYEIAEAVSYMLRYTSNPSSCNVHTNCSAPVDTTKYNPNYAYYVGYDATGKPNHVDCANYISQALSEGGIPEDNTWKPGSNTWVGVSNLTTYMLNNGYWSSVTYNVVQKGDILSSTSGSHLMMITAFDGATYRYSGHTYDRRNVTITINSSSPYRYYRAG